MNLDQEVDFNLNTRDKKPKIIYLSYIRLTDRVSRTWFLNDLVSRGFDIEYWDLVRIMRENHREYNEIKPIYLKELNSMTELDEQLKNQVKNVVYVILFPQNNTTLSVYKKLSKLKVKMVYIDWGAMPLYLKRAPISRIKYIFCKVIHIKNLAEVLESKKIHLLQRLNIIKKFDIVFASGNSLQNKPRHANKLVSIPFADYSEYKNVIENSKNKVSGFAVFLDINLPFQSDLSLERMPQIDPIKYYSQLNLFFEKIEKIFNLTVVIAAHPKTELNSSYFFGRIVNRLKTAELVRDAEFVISHQSTSISYAILNYKPIIFFYTDEMKLLYEDSVVSEIKYLANYFDLDALNYESLTKLGVKSLNQVNKKIYDKYIEDFIVSRRSKHLSPSEVFISEVTSLCNKAMV